MTRGTNGLLSWLESYVAQVHDRPLSQENARISVGAGSQELLYKAFLALVDAEDSILLEAPTYA